MPDHSGTLSPPYLGGRGAMEFPKLKKRLKGLLDTVGRVMDTTKKVVLSAGIITA